MDDKGNVIFNGANRDIEQTNLLHDHDSEIAEIARDIITAARKPGGGFVRYNWDDPAIEEDDVDGPGGSSPKLAYVKAIPINKRTAETEADLIYYIFGSGIYLQQ